MTVSKSSTSESSPALPILEIRGQPVLLDADLARIYGVPTHRFNQAIKRNRHRFPDDFSFQLTEKEYLDLRSQTAISSLQTTDFEHNPNLKSHFVITSSHGGRRYLPWVFTEHGCLMAATVLRSEQAVRMSIYVIRAFVQMRTQLAANADLLRRLAEIDKTLLEHDQSLQFLWDKLQPLLIPPSLPPKPPIGFNSEI